MAGHIIFAPARGWQAHGAKSAFAYPDEAAINRSMLILAIDTALDACAAAVLDTDTAKIIAQESQAMKRGHAEALMPLIARVMKASGIAFTSLDRVAVTKGPGSFTGLRVGLSAARGIALAAGKPVVGVDDADRLRRAFRRREQRASDHLRDRCAPRPCVFPGGERRRRFAGQAEGGADIGSARSRALRRAASGRQRRQNPRRPLAFGCAAAVQGRRRSRRPTSPGWRGSAPPSARRWRRPVPIICARPTPSRRRIRCRRRSQPAS